MQELYYGDRSFIKDKSEINNENEKVQKHTYNKKNSSSSKINFLTII